MDDDLSYIPEVVPLFPLPEVVLFPRTLLPLHVFEPRYRRMTSDALAGERVIATVLLKPGFEPLYYTRQAPIHPVVSIAHIVGSEEVEDGNYNILLRGLTRARIVGESSDRPYRLAQVEAVDTYCSSGAQRSDELRDELLGTISSNLALDADLRRHWLRLFDAGPEIDELADLIAAGLPASAELRQCLLDEPDASTRIEIMQHQLRALAAAARTRRRVDVPDEHHLN